MNWFQTHPKDHTIFLRKNPSVAPSNAQNKMFFEARSHSVAQNGLQLTILLPYPPWNCRHAPPRPAQNMNSSLQFPALHGQLLAIHHGAPVHACLFAHCINHFGLTSFLDRTGSSPKPFTPQFLFFEIHYPLGLPACSCCYQFVLRLKYRFLGEERAASLRWPHGYNIILVYVA